MRNCGKNSDKLRTRRRNWQEAQRNRDRFGKVILYLSASSHSNLSWQATIFAWSCKSGPDVLPWEAWSAAPLTTSCTYASRQRIVTTNESKSDKDMASTQTSLIIYSQSVNVYPRFSIRGHLPMLDGKSQSPGFVERVSWFFIVATWEIQYVFPLKHPPLQIFLIKRALMRFFARSFP